MVQTVRRSEPIREMTDEEVEELNLGSTILGVDGLLKDIEGEAEYVMTGAQLAMLEVEGGGTVSIPGLDDAPDVDYGQTIFQIGSGRTKFTARLTDDTGDHEKVFVYDNLGERWPVKRSLIQYYRAKGFHLRPPRGRVITAEFRCPSTLRPHTKAFRTELDAQDHFRTFHEREWRSEERHRELMRQERLDALLESVVANQEQGGGESVDMKRLVTLMTELLGEQKKANTKVKEPANA